MILVHEIGGSAWFVFNSDIKAKGVPMKPVAPTEVVQPQEPAYEGSQGLAASSESASLSTFAARASSAGLSRTS